MWSLLKSDGDWLNYLETAAAAVGLPLEAARGNGPLEYPALATSHCAKNEEGKDRMFTAYVYRADARRLFDDKSAPKPDPKPSRPGPLQSEFNKVSAANTLAVAHFLIATGICTRAQYESKLALALSLVDEVDADNKAALDLGRLLSGMEGGN